jgi:hypothetical protein
MEISSETPKKIPSLYSMISDLTVIKDLDKKPIKADGETISKAIQARDGILWWAHNKREDLPTIINELVKIGSDFNMIRKGDRIGALLGVQENLVDGKTSSGIVTEIILKIGEPALPLLESNNANHAKYLASKLRGNLRAKQMDRFFKKITHKIVK